MEQQAFVPPWQRRRRLQPARPVINQDGQTGKTATGKTPYQMGRAFEGAVRGRLQRRGYYVMRSHMSKGVADLVALGTPCLEKGVTGLFIQCKRRGALGTEEWNRLCELAWLYGGWPVLTMKLSEKTVGFYRLDEVRAPRTPKKPMTLFDPANLKELLPPPTLL
jgi:Holliday junction resolvase